MGESNKHNRVEDNNTNDNKPRAAELGEPCLSQHKHRRMHMHALSCYYRALSLLFTHEQSGERNSNNNLHVDEIATSASCCFAILIWAENDSAFLNGMILIKTELG